MKPTKTSATTNATIIQTRVAPLGGAQPAGDQPPFQACEDPNHDRPPFLDVGGADQVHERVVQAGRRPADLPRARRRR